MEEYEFETQNNIDKRVYILIIYDIIDNKRRARLVKLLKGYGFRVQKSCFEAFISGRLYEELRRKLSSYAGSEDSIRMYRIIGKGQVTSYGQVMDREQRDVIIV